MPEGKPLAGHWKREGYGCKNVFQLFLATPHILGNPVGDEESESRPWGNVGH